MVTREENLLYGYLLGYSVGGFTEALFDAFFKADSYNRDALGKGFPEIAEVVRRYSFEDGYWQRLQERVRDGRCEH